jgi:hypothetical protein
MISSLMLGYDTNVIGNNNASSTNCVVIKNQSLSQPIIQQQRDNLFLNQGMMMEANFFTSEENQFDRFKVMYSSSCDLASLDLQLQGRVGMDALRGGSRL